MIFGDKISEYKDDILRDLKTLMEIQSVSSQGSESCGQALEFVLGRARALGLDVKNIEDKAGHVQLGNKGKLCAALTHLDVVPAGGNWSVPPYTLTKRGGRLFGRGIADDKGASIINLYCLKALLDNKVEGKNTLRAIFGTNEEIGGDDMETYFRHEALPDIAFTPDSEYGICYAEKGILQLRLSCDRNDGKILSAIKAGDAVNAVPDEAKALLYFSESDASALKRRSKECEGEFDFQETIDGLVITSRGKSAHACEPEKGFNAALALVNLLNHNLSPEGVGSLCDFIGFAVQTQTDGTSLGLKMSDYASGNLSVCVGKIRINDSKAYITLDIRYPVTMNGEKILAQVEKVAKLRDIRVSVLNHNPPLFLPKESETIALLSSAYEEITGQAPEFYSTGGGTYARALGSKGVAFGPAFREDNVRIHNCDESMDEEKFFTHARICLQTLYKMYTQETE